MATYSMEESGSDMSAIKQMMMETHGDGKKSVWTTTLETFGMADGKTKKSDILVDTVEQGLALLNDYVAEIQKKEPGSLCWDLVPRSQFNATQDDFLLAFLKWAEKDAKDTDSNTASVTTTTPDKTKVNVTKALRRVNAYFQWMEENRKDLQEPLTVDSVAATAKIWDIQVTYSEKDQLVWWIDLGSLDRDTLKEIDSKDHLRYIVWFSHMVMFNERARSNGAIIIEDMGNMGFWKLATLVPSDLSTKLDRLTIGILPVKMNTIYVFGAATWMTLLVNLMKPFMGKKMRDRMVLVPKKTDMQTFCDELVTRKNIPAEFCGILGESPRDVVFKSFANK